MSMSTSNQARPSIALRWAVIAAIAGVAFFASYRYAVAAGTGSQTVVGTSGPVAASTGGGGCCGGGGATAGAASGAGAVAGATGVGATAGAAGGGGCCGGGAKGPAVTKSAAVAGGVQKISVDLSKGYYDPSTIQLKAGVPAEITFGQASGCTGIVQSQQLGFSEDLSGGPKTVKLAALQPGTYQFACGMGMVTGSIVVQ
jgi:plastocyanin